MMKKLFALCCLAAAAFGAWSCSDDYDDTALWQEIEQIKRDEEDALTDGYPMNRTVEVTEDVLLDGQTGTTQAVSGEE